MVSHITSSGIPFNYRYLIAKAAQTGGRALDYGCGMGHAVALGRIQNLDIWGADTLANNYSEWRSQIRPEAQDRIKIITSDRADFLDGHFDFIFSNQVLEHVRNPEAVVADIFRLLKPGGVFIGAFPVVETWYEGHVGLYFAHRFKAGSSARRVFFNLCHRLGFGLYRGTQTRAQWVEMAEKTLDDACCYYPRSRLLPLFELTFGSAPEDIGADYMRIRLANRARFVPDVADSVLRLVYRLRAGEIIRIQKRST